jgi:hypothetical protein
VKGYGEILLQLFKIFYIRNFLMEMISIGNNY